MREIKFRAWDNYMGKWSTDFDMDNDGVVYPAATPYSKNPDIRIMQYTGLKDRHGKEIYEGDIVKQYQTSRGHVYAKQNLRVIKWVNASHSTGFNISERGTHRTEVVGNIHENPELLNEK